jgi:predicted nucleotidyltransferase
MLEILTEVDNYFQICRIRVGKVISQEHLKQIIEDYRSRLVATLGDELDSIVLYGSQARQEAVEGSDIDILCVMNTPFRYGDLISRTSNDTAEISLKYDVVISRVFVTRKVYESRCSPFLMNVHKEQLAI